MKNSKKYRNVALALALGFSLSLAAGAEKRPEKKENTSFSVLDSTEAQWGMRSINDSVYRGYTVNAVYLERGRQALPDSFNMYRATPVNAERLSPSEDPNPPTTFRVNGKEQQLPDYD